MSGTTQPSNRKFYVLVAAFLLAAVLMGVLTASRSGPTELERLKAELRSKGEKLTLAELIPSAGQTNHPPFRTNDLSRLAKALAVQDKQVENLETIHHLGNGLAEPVWKRTNLLTSASRSSPGSSIEWVAVEADLVEVETTLIEVRALVVVPDLHAGKNYGVNSVYPDYRRDKHVLSRWLALAHAANMRQPQLAAALADLEAAIQLTDWHREEMTLSDQLHRVGTASIALGLTWSTVQEPSLTDAQLAAMLARWERVILATNLPGFLEVERAIGQSAFAFAQERGISAVYGESVGAHDVIGRLTSAGDELFFLQHFQAVLLMSRKAQATRSFAAVTGDFTALDAGLESTYGTWRGFQLFLSRLLLAQNYQRLHRRFFRYETHREMTVSALALELHRRKHGRHPDALTRLVPEFLSAVPVDWMDGKPLRYRLNPDGSFTLWSVGDNLTDDGGDASGAPVNMRRNDFWEGRDAVWPRPAP